MSETSPGGTTQQFTWNTLSFVPQLLMDGSNAYIYGPQTSSLGNAPVEQISLSAPNSQSSASYLLSDPEGVRLTFNSSGTITADASYDAYGNVIGGGLSSVTPFGYAGGYTDPTGLIYLVNRYYDPSTGQFLSVDPLVGVTDQPYQYVGGDPVNGSDPNGMCASGIGQFTKCSAPHFTQVEEGGFFGLFATTLYVNTEFYELVNGGKSSLEDELYVLWFNVYQTQYSPSNPHVGQPSGATVNWLQNGLVYDAQWMTTNQHACSFPGHYFMEFACGVAEVLSFYKGAGGQATMQAIKIFQNMYGHGDQSLEYLVYHYSAQYINLANTALKLYQNIMNDMSDYADAAYVISSGCSLS